MTTLTTFYELRVRELAVRTHRGKGSQCCSRIPQTGQSVSPSVIGLSLYLCLWTTADCWLCPEAWGPSLKCQEINKAWEQGSTRNWVSGQVHGLPHSHPLDGLIPRHAFFTPHCLPMDMSVPAHGIGISTPTPSHCAVARWHSLQLPGNCMPWYVVSGLLLGNQTRAPAARHGGFSSLCIQCFFFFF